MESSEGSGLRGISFAYHLTFKSLRRAGAALGFFNPPVWRWGPSRVSVSTHSKF